MVLKVRFFCTFKFSSVGVIKKTKKLSIEFTNGTCKYQMEHKCFNMEDENDILVTANRNILSYILLNEISS